jgi:hypothetical protein
MTVSEYVKSWIREHQQTSNRLAVKGMQETVSGEEGIREDLAPSGKGTHTWISGEEGIREDQPPFNNAICVYTAQVYKARVKQQPGNARYDTDSKIIRIDNCASYSISFDKNDFITPLKPVRQKVKGLGGVLDGLQTGTIEWKVEDDEGMPYVIKLPGSLYVPNSPSRLLSPQHWAQTASGDQPWCETYHDEVRLLWNGGKGMKTAKLSKETGNVATIYTAPGFQAYHTFMEESGLKDQEELMTFAQNVISDDEASDGEEEIRQSSRAESMNLEPVEPSSKQDEQTGQQCEFELDGPKGTEAVQTPTIIEDEEDSPKLESVAAEFLKKHHCLNHLSTAKMQVMAKQGILPKKWAKCDIPICTSCLYGKATRRPWRT